MAHQATDGSMWTNASQAKKRSMAVPGKAQGDGKQPVSRFSKPEAPRAYTNAAPASNGTHEGEDNQEMGEPQHQDSNVEITHDGSSFVVTARFSSQEEAQAAAQQLSGSDQGEGGSSPDHDMPQPPAGMM